MNVLPRFLHMFQFLLQRPVVSATPYMQFFPVAAKPCLPIFGCRCLALTLSSLVFEIERFAVFENAQP